MAWIRLPQKFSHPFHSSIEIYSIPLTRNVDSSPIINPPEPARRIRASWSAGKQRKLNNEPRWAS